MDQTLFSGNTVIDGNGGAIYSEVGKHRNLSVIFSSELRIQWRSDLFQERKHHDHLPHGT